MCFFSLSFHCRAKRQRAFTFNCFTTHAKFKIDFIRQRARLFHFKQHNSTKMHLPVSWALFISWPKFIQSKFALSARHTLAFWPFQYFCVDVQTLATNFSHRIISSLNYCSPSYTLSSVHSHPSDSYSCSLRVYEWRTICTLHISNILHFLSNSNQTLCARKTVGKIKSLSQIKHE